MAILRVEQKNEKPYEVELDRERLTIGRSSSNDLVFNHLSLSRHHARIVREDSKFLVEDAGSRNGTFLNGVRIQQQSPLKTGDIIQLGEIALRFLDPMSDKVQVTDTAPALGMDGTFMINTDELNIKRYAQEALSVSAISPAAIPSENIWPALNQAAATLITHYPIDKLVEVIMDIVFQAVPADRGALLMLDPAEPGQLQLKTVRAPGGQGNLEISRTILNEVMKNQHAVLTMDASTDSRFESSQSIQLQGIRSIICVPLWNNKDVIGLIYMDTLISRRTFTQSDLRLIALIANMAAVKIENAALLEDQLEKKRIEEQLAVAAQIQRRLLPQVNPVVSNYEVFGINRSCYEIGGDYYDFIRRDDGKLVVLIADVSGKGIGAALLMAAFQASIRTLVKTETDPAVLIGKLNQVMIENSPPNKYITVFYGELDPATHRFQYTNAGHNPPMLFRSGDCTPLPPCGPVVGILPDPVYTCREITMEPQDLLCLYTDGITECQDPHEAELGEEGVRSFLRNNHAVPAEDLARLLEDHIREFTHAAAPIDDATLIFLKRVN